MKNLLIAAVWLTAATLSAQTNTDREGWTMVWHDEFDGTGPLDTNTWTAETGFVRNEEYQWYQQENAYRQDGLLVLEARIDSVPNPRFRASQEPASPTARGRQWRELRPYARYTSASVTTRNSFSFKYGRMEVRARIPAVCGSWPAIWTLGTTMPWPACGECDIMEYYQVKGEPTILANACWSNNRRGAEWNSKRISYQHFLSKDCDWGMKFHTWLMDWTEDRICIYLDGELLNNISLKETVNADRRFSGINPFHQPHYILLDLAIGGQNGGEPDDSAFPMRYEIDYVRIYQKK